MKSFKLFWIALFLFSGFIFISCSSKKKPEPQPEAKQDSVVMSEPVKTEEPAPAPEPVKKKKVQPVQEEESYPATVYSLPKERSAGDIGRVITSHDTEMKELLNSYKAKDPSLSGTIVISAVVSPAGSVVSTSVKSSTITDKSLERALTMRVRLWKFGEIDAKSGNQTYDIPYGFSR